MKYECLSEGKEKRNENKEKKNIYSDIQQGLR